jgi:DNA-binding MarR family transcriptional regulator
MYNAIASDYGISQTIGYILTYVEKDGTPSTRIATQLGMKKSSLTRILKKMEDDGCIYRVSDTIDKRIVKIFLTEKGVERRKIAKKTVLDFNDKLNSFLEEEDLVRFEKVTDIIKELVEEELQRRDIK